MQVNGFHSNREGQMKLKRYELNKKLMGNSESILSTKNLLSYIEGKNVKQELMSHDFVKGLKLANRNFSPECGINRV